MTPNQWIINDCLYYLEHALDKIIRAKPEKEERWKDDYTDHMQRVCASWRFV